MITTAQILYAIPDADGSQRYTYHNSVQSLPAGVTQRKTGASQWCTVEVHDGRALSPPPSLLRNGYCLARDFDTTLDFHSDGLDSEKIVRTYYPEMRRLVTEALGGAGAVKRAIVFDHTLRSPVRKATGAKETNGQIVRDYADVAHNDNTSASAKNRVRLLSKPKEEGGSFTLAHPAINGARGGKNRVWTVWDI